MCWASSSATPSTTRVRRDARYRRIRLRAGLPRARRRTAYQGEPVGRQLLLRDEGPLHRVGLLRPHSIRSGRCGTDARDGGIRRSSEQPASPPTSPLTGSNRQDGRFPILGRMPRRTAAVMHPPPLPPRRQPTPCGCRALSGSLWREVDRGTQGHLRLELGEERGMNKGQIIHALHAPAQKAHQPGYGRGA